MRTSRRNFLRTASAAAAVPMLGPKALDSLERRLEAYAGLDARDAVQQEDFWAEIRRMYPVPSDYVNLENGYSSPQPAPTYAAFQEYEKTVNNGLSFYMRRRMTDDRAAVKQALATLAGVTPEEIVITRNTTESLGTVIHGLDHQPGDEAVMCDQDYGSMLQQFRQEAKRRGLKCVEISIPLVPRDDQEIVDVYANAITARTKVLLLSHMVNITGHILPVKKIADMAHARGVAVIVDAAHSFAHVKYAVPDLGGDYLGASLHKWLCTPLGAGLLYVKKENIAKVWPLFGE
ncbi:MAG TPA: aminotransferase class V-fold PLP-dependent enzyme, partial [Vicinamibacterales bacterium]